MAEARDCQNAEAAEGHAYEDIGPELQAMIIAMMEPFVESQGIPMVVPRRIGASNGEARGERERTRGKHYLEVAAEIAPELAAVNEALRRTGVQGDGDETSNDKNMVSSTSSDTSSCSNENNK